MFTISILVLVLVVLAASAIEWAEKRALRNAKAKARQAHLANISKQASELGIKVPSFPSSFEPGIGYVGGCPVFYDRNTDETIWPPM